jgi:hypothetical protein
VYILIPNSVTPLMKNMYTVGVLVHGVHHTLPVSQVRGFLLLIVGLDDFFHLTCTSLGRPFLF